MVTSKEQLGLLKDCSEVFSLAGDEERGPGDLSHSIPGVLRLMQHSKSELWICAATVSLRDVVKVSRF